jgi:hypothetical protein
MIRRAVTANHYGLPCCSYLHSRRPDEWKGNITERVMRFVQKIEITTARFVLVAGDDHFVIGSLLSLLKSLKQRRLGTYLAFVTDACCYLPRERYDAARTREEQPP